MKDEKTTTTESSNSMKLWNCLAKTDPNYTKEINLGAMKFTAVDAHYQIQRMTEVFGPIGKGWKWTAEHEIDNGLYFASITVHWKDDEGWYSYGPITSCYSLTKGNGKVDDEAPKKCTTDALTKALSHLGLSADVFLGMFDNSKYVENLKKEFATDTRSLKQMLTTLHNFKTVKAVDTWGINEAKPWSAGASEDDKTELRDAMTIHKQKLREDN
jgi:hypothetical protein